MGAAGAALALAERLRREKRRPVVGQPRCRLSCRRGSGRGESGLGRRATQRTCRRGLASGAGWLGRGMESRPCERELRGATGTGRPARGAPAGTERHTAPIKAAVL